MFGLFKGLNSVEHNFGIIDLSDVDFDVFDNGIDLGVARAVVESNAKLTSLTRRLRYYFSLLFKAVVFPFTLLALVVLVNLFPLDSHLFQMFLLVTR